MDSRASLSSILPPCPSSSFTSGGLPLEYRAKTSCGKLVLLQDFSCKKFPRRGQMSKLSYHAKHFIIERLASSSGHRQNIGPSQEPSDITFISDPSLETVISGFSPTDSEERTRGFKFNKLSCCDSDFYLGRKWIKNSRLLTPSTELCLLFDFKDQTGL